MDKQRRTASVKAYVKAVPDKSEAEHKPYTTVEYEVELTSKESLSTVVENIYDKGIYKTSDDALEFYPPEVILNIIVRYKTTKDETSSADSGDGIHSPVNP
jgi:hypothetical protein